MPNDFTISKLIGGKVLPPLPPYPKGEAVTIENNDGYALSRFVAEASASDNIEQTIFGTPMVVPLSVKLPGESDWFLFPAEPLISIEGQSILIRRNVAKKNNATGSIKEYWTDDDWSIEVQGLLTEPGTEDFPDDQFNDLLKYLTAKEPLDVKCAALERAGITKMVIYKRSLPFTKGPENQSFSFSAFSDSDWDLLIKKTTNVL
jgi:hypothetical protein